MSTRQPDRDPDAPTVLVPKIPGTAVIAAVGGVLVLGLAVIMGLNWSRGTLAERWIETDLPPVADPPLDSAAPMDPVRVQLRAWTDGAIPIESLVAGFGWEPLGQDLWRWPAAGPEGAAIITLEGAELEISPLRADLLEALTAEAEGLDMIIEVQPLPSPD